MSWEYPAFHHWFKYTNTAIIPGCFLWRGPTLKFYGFVWKDVDGQLKRRYVHRLSYQRFIGPIKEGNEIHHTCRNVECWNPKHLLQVTKEEHVLEHQKMYLRKRMTELFGPAKEE